MQQIRKKHNTTNKKTQLKTIRVILFIIILKACPTYQATQSYGPFEIKTSQISSSCKDLDDITYSKYALVEKAKTISKVLSFGEDYIEEYFKTGDKSKFKDLGYQAIKVISWIWVFILWSILGSLISFIYFVARAIQRGVHRVKKRRKERNRGGTAVEFPDQASNRNIGESGENLNFKGANSSGAFSIPQKSRYQGDSIIFTRRAKSIVFCCNLLTGILIFVIAVRWSYIAFQTLKGLKKTDCAISRVYSYFEDGIKTPESKFLGLNGYERVLEDFSKEMGSLKKMENALSDVDTQVSAISGSILTFSTLYSTATVQSAKDIAYLMYTDTTRRMHPNTISLAIGREVDDLLKGAQITYAYGISSERIASNDKNTYDLVGIGFDMLLSYAKLGMDELKEFTSKYTYGIRGPILILFIWIVLISISLLTVIFLMATCYSYKVRKYIKTSICCQVVITVYFFLLASTINIIAVVSFGFGAIGTNVCSYANEMIEKANYSRAAIPETLHVVTDRCLYDTAKGNIVTGSVRGGVSSTISITDVFNIFDGIGLNRANYNITEGGNSRPLPELRKFKKRLDDIQSFNVYDFEDENSKGKGYRDIIPQINAIINCAKDEVQYDPNFCTYNVKSTTEDAVDAHLEDNYCIVLSNFNHTDLKKRYETKPCAQEAVALFKPVKLQFDQHTALIKEMIEFYDEKILPEYMKAIKKLEQTMPEVEKGKTQVPNTASFFLEKGYSYGEISDCRFIRPYVTTAVGNFCFELVINFAFQTRYLVTLGPLMTFFATCLCCAVIQTRTKNVEGDEFLIKGMVRPAGFGLDIDNAPGGWGIKKKKSKKDEQAKIDLEFDGFAHFDEEDVFEKKGSLRDNKNKINEFKSTKKRDEIQGENSDSESEEEKKSEPKGVEGEKEGDMDLKILQKIDKDEGKEDKVKMKKKKNKPGKLPPIELPEVEND